MIENLTLTTLEWRQPAWFLILLIPLMMPWLQRQLFRRRLVHQVDRHLLPWLSYTPPLRQQSLRLFYRCYTALLWLLLAAALAGPRSLAPGHERAAATDAAVVFIFDTSLSMSAADVGPNRLERAKLEILQWLGTVPAIRAGIVVYAGRAHVLSPITADKSALAFYLDQLDTRLLPSAGNNLQDAISQAQQMVEQQGIKRAHLILLSDGDFGHTIKISSPYPLHIIGLGTRQGAGLPAPEGGWRYDGERKIVSRLHESALRALAQEQKGHYVRLSDGQDDYQSLYVEHIAQAMRADDSEKSAQIWDEYYPLPLAGFVTGLLIFTIPWRRLVQRTLFSRKLRSSATTDPTAALFILILATVLMLNPQTTLAATDPDYRTAYQLFVEGHYEQARAQFSRLSGYSARLATGASAYRLDDMPTAMLQFHYAFVAAIDDGQRAQALYNLGNTYFKMQDYKRALETFEAALLYNPHYIQAQHNRDFTAQVIRDSEGINLRPGRARNRGSRGPRTQRPDENFDPAGGDFQLDDTPPVAENKPPSPINAAGDAVKDATVISQRTGDQSADLFGQVDVIQVESTRQRLLRQGQKAYGLFKSLFEQEEGYPAHVSEPIEIEGQRPW